MQSLFYGKQVLGRGGLRENELGGKERQPGVGAKAQGPDFLQQCHKEVTITSPYDEYNRECQAYTGRKDQEAKAESQLGSLA